MSKIYNIIDRLDLPALTCDAAIEIDLLIHGKNTNYNSYNRIIQILNNPELLDYSFLFSIIQSATLKDTWLHFNVDYLNNFIKNISNKKDLVELSSLRDFFLYLSKEASKQRQKELVDFYDLFV